MRFSRQRLFFPIAALLCCCAGLLPAGEPAGASIDPHRYLEHVKYLASEELKGRGTASPGLESAAGYIAGQFRQVGLEPAGGEDFFQPFPVTVNAKLGRSNRFEYTGERGRQVLKFREEFIPLNFSASGAFTGRVVFAGYGITAHEYGYDDYAGLDVKGKTVLLLRHEPQEFDENSRFAGRVYTEHSQFFSKALNARLHGARGVIFVNDIANHGGEAGELEPFVGSAGPADAGIPVVHAKAGIVQTWLAPLGKDLKTIQAEIDKDLRPRSFPLPDSFRVSITAEVERETRHVRNVLGYLPGSGDEYVVIGAHYDHLGLGEQFSMSPSQAGTPHPGADDNASGTAGMLELARWFAGRPKQRRGLLFVAFAGEELGLLGSSFYVNAPRLPLTKAVAMINLDMIGRVENGKVFVGGTSTGSGLRELVESKAGTAELNIDLSDETGYGSSDHACFTAREVPVLFFFSGLHGDYHRPSDTWEKIRAPEAAKLLEFAAGVVGELAQSAGRPQFVRVTGVPSEQGPAVTGAGQPARE